MAEGVFAACAEGMGHVADSAGTGAWHIGNAPDPRAIAAAGARGYDITGQRARRLTAEDFARFDLILGMDRANLRAIAATRPRGNATPVRRLLDHGPGPWRDVPDPYYEGSFDEVLDMIEVAVARLVPALDDLRA